MKNSEGVLIYFSSVCPLHMLLALWLRDAVCLCDAVYGSGQVKNTTEIRRENPSSREENRCIWRLPRYSSNLAIVTLVLSGIKRQGDTKKVNVQNMYSVAGRTAPTTHVMPHGLPGRASHSHNMARPSPPTPTQRHRTSCVDKPATAERPSGRRARRRGVHWGRRSRGRRTVTLQPLGTLDRREQNANRRRL